MQDFVLKVGATKFLTEIMLKHMFVLSYMTKYQITSHMTKVPDSKSHDKGAR